MIMGKARQLEKEEAGHIANAIRKQTETNGGVQIALLFEVSGTQPFSP